MVDRNKTKNVQMKGDEKEMRRNEKAITLIALIITIIILVILAAVSIRAVYNMGIVGHAINGTKEYATKAKDENDIIDQTGKKIDDAVAKVKEIQEEKKNGNTEEEQVNENDPIVYFDNNYLLRKSGKLCTYNTEKLSQDEYIEATSENLNEMVIANNVKFLNYNNNYYITDDNKLYRNILEPQFIASIKRVVNSSNEIEEFIDIDNNLINTDGTVFLNGCENAVYSSVYDETNTSLLKSNGGLFCISNNKLYYVTTWEGGAYFDDAQLGVVDFSEVVGCYNEYVKLNDGSLIYLNWLKLYSLQGGRDYV